MFQFLPIIFGIGTLLSFAAWIYSLIHILRNSALRDMEKIMWIIVAIFLNILGSVLYFLIAPPSTSAVRLAPEQNTA